MGNGKQGRFEFCKFIISLLKKNSNTINHVSKMPKDLLKMGITAGAPKPQRTVSCFVLPRTHF